MVTLIEEFVKWFANPVGDAAVAMLYKEKGIFFQQVKEDIATARSFGDLSENSEYDEARNEQAKVEARITELEELVLNAIIVDESKIDTSIVNVGSLVKVRDIEFDEIEEYSIVGSNEVDPLVNRISDMSPIGKALIGKRAGDKLSVETPGGIVELEVLEVSRTTGDK